jgi:hypothetical protein
MPLLDHFHAPLLLSYPWESFHVLWAVSIGDYLNTILPRRYFVTIHTHLGSRVEADVAEFERSLEPEDVPSNGGTEARTGGTAVAMQIYAPPAAVLTLPAVFPDTLEVQVHDERDSARLVAVIEWVSPGNKDRDETRRAFAAKCATYLQVGIGLIVADIVTSRQANLHNELIALLGLGSQFRMPADSGIYAVAYRPARRNEVNEIDVWPAVLEVGATLPILPLGLRSVRAIPLDLEATYTQARQRGRIE